MKFKIKEQVMPKYKDSFVVKIKVMHGDADGYSELEVSGFRGNCQKSKLHMEDLIQTLKEMEAEYPHGRGGFDTYDHLEGFPKWFGGEILDEHRDWYEDLEDWEQKMYWSDWPLSPDGYGTQASFESYSVYYYDENGVKYYVEVEE